MNASEFNAARAVLALTDEELATALVVTADVVGAWSSGTTRIPRHYARLIEWLVAGEQRRAALKAEGIPDCEWMERQEEALSSDSEDFDERMAEVASHRKSCPVCLRQEKFLNDRFGPMPGLPAPGWLRVIVWVGDRLPPWARPAAVGALGLAAIVSLRLLFAIPTLLSSPRNLAVALLAVVTAAGAGASGGLAHSLCRPTLKRLGRVGDYLTGIVCVGTYMASLILVAPFAFGEPIVKDRASIVIFGVVAIFFGLVVGHSWFRDPKSERSGKSVAPAT